MIRRLFILLAALSTLSLLSGCVINVQRVEPGTKAKDGSVYLGFDLVSSKKRDKDFTTVKKELGKFSKFRLHVSKAPANIKRLTLHFGNGDKFNVRLKPRFGKNDWSRWVDLPGGKRRIKKIVVVASRAAKKGRWPKLEYYAR